MLLLFFGEKWWQSERLKNWFSSLTSPAVFTEAIFCVLPFTHLLINFIPFHTLLILLYVKWLSILFSYCFLFFTNFLFQFLLHRPIFFLIILLERKFLPVDDVFNPFSLIQGLLLGNIFTFDLSPQIPTSSLHFGLVGLLFLHCYFSASGLLFSNIFC